MTSTVQERPDVSVVHGRAFARTSSRGVIDGYGDRGIYAEDLRLLRRVEAYRAGQDVPVPGVVAVDEHGCVVRFELQDVAPGTGVLLVVELDGTDLFTVRQLRLDGGAEGEHGGLGLGDARPDARVRLEVRCDGAQLVDRDGFSLSDAPVRADGTPRTASWRWDVPASAAAAVDVVIDLRAAWALTSDEQPEPVRDFVAIDAARRDALDEWLAARPRAVGGGAIEQILASSLADLASLRIDGTDGAVLAGGVPWFLTVFGRDALLSAWMALPVDPDLAGSTLRHLARTQATDYDLATDAEPGKILHEERRGVAARRWHERYYGSVDSTPLFVMLLAETVRWTGDDTLARDLEQEVRRAIGWILSRIDEDELGMLSYWRRAERGLDVQSWKDSFDSQRDHDGRVATGLIRPIEAQGYAVAALRGASRLAKSVWDDDVIASEWAAAARVLERRLVDRCLVELPVSQLDPQDDPRAGGFLAQAVDSAGLPLDALCSNPGHLLWADAIADPLLRGRVVSQLTHPALDSGWGIRTMSMLDRGYDPASYHCGSVWPHDTAICIAGIARSDRDAAARLALGLVEAAAGSGGRLPELFSGTTRQPGASSPDALPVACSPQAWAAASPILLVRSLLGLEPDAGGSHLVSTVEAAPAWLAGLSWRGIHALGRRWDIEVDGDGRVDIVEALTIRR